MPDSLLAISPIDGRYAGKTESLQLIFSEYGLIRNRAIVELRWLQTLARHPDITELTISDDGHQKIDAMVADFNAEDAARVKEIEETTNHDVKAVEYLLKEKFDTDDELASAAGFLHFACTSEDINNLSYALSLQHACAEVMMPAVLKVTEALHALAKTHAETPMLSRTHGQTATPTTLGKEMATGCRPVTILLNHWVLPITHTQLKLNHTTIWRRYSMSTRESIQSIPTTHETYGPTYQLATLNRNWSTVK